MPIEYLFYTKGCTTVLIAISTLTVVVAIVRYLRLRTIDREPLRTRAVSICACALFIAFAGYQNVPVVVDSASVARTSQLIARQYEEDNSAGWGPPVQDIVTPSGAPIWWHYTHANTGSMKVGPITFNPVRIGLNLFVLVASCIALASLLKNLKKVSLSSLLFGQLLVACFVFLYMEMRPSLRGPASICLLIAPQLVFVILNLLVWKRNHRVHPSTRRPVFEN